MTATGAKGFRAVGVRAGIKATGRDLALVVNDGPDATAAGFFTRNRVKAAPVLWSEQVLKGRVVRAVVLNSGGANACTGPPGFQDTHATAERVAARLSAAGRHLVGAADVAVCSTGPIGERLPIAKLLTGVDTAVRGLSREGGASAAEAILTTDTRAKTTRFDGGGYVIGGMAKGAGALAPALATLLVVLTTDAVCDVQTLEEVLAEACANTFERIDTDGCMSTNDTVLLLASGASRISPERAELAASVTAACADLARQVVGDTEGASKEISILVQGAASTADAVAVGRAIARSNLVKCAFFGNDPSWGRIMATIGTTSAEFVPEQIDITINGVPVCVGGTAGIARTAVDLAGRSVTVIVDLHAGIEEATIVTTDLTPGYIRVNSGRAS